MTFKACVPKKEGGSVSVNVMYKLKNVMIQVCILGKLLLCKTE